MSALGSLLTLYGALDTAVQEADDPLVLQTVDRFLPGASTHAGWSEEIRRFLSTEENQFQTTGDIGEDVSLALNGITTPLAGEPPLSIPMKSRMVYILGALTHIEAAKSDTRNRPGFIDALTIAQPPDTSVREQRQLAEELLTALTLNFTGWQDWDEITALSDLLDPLIADVPLCIPAVVKVEGYDCVVIDAILTSSTVKFKNLKDVVDALNWPKAYPSFFCSVTDLGLRTDKWRGILERAGLCHDNSYILKTPLKYIKSAPSNITATLDYDLIEKNPVNAMALGGDGKVLVDKGYINMRCTSDGLDPDKPGVWVRTRKVAHVTGLSPYAQAKFLCICGYGYAAAEMIFGAAEDVEDHPGDYRPWSDDPLKDADELESDMEDAKAGAPAPVGPGEPPPPPNMDAVTKIVKKWKDCVDLLTTTHLDLTGKWLAGQLSYGELAKTGAQVGAKIGSDPWLLLHELTQAPKPGPTPPGPVEGGGP
jgi:hypothetical protein